MINLLQVESQYPCTKMIATIHSAVLLLMKYLYERTVLNMEAVFSIIDKAAQQ